VDLGVSWRPIKSLEIGLYGENLLDGEHPEFTSDKTTVITEIPRSVMGRITWRF
jgi:iron complex outermembrane receptor protein